MIRIERIERVSMRVSGGVEGCGEILSKWA